MSSLFVRLLFLCLVISIQAIGFTASSLNDTEASVSNTFTAGTWEITITPSPTPTKVVINEVYYDVVEGENEGNTVNPDEWVELYNNSDDPMNLKNWSISDNTNTRTISHSDVYIPAKGFVVLAKSANTWTNWSIPSEAEKISLGQKIGNGLKDDGDRLILKDNNNNEVDAVSWGDDTYVFNPSVTDVPEGHSISRKVKGLDTNTAADWMDTFSGSTPVGPNPGTNPHLELKGLTPEVSLNLSNNGKSVSFKVTNIQNFINLSYQLTYNTDTIPDGVEGTADLNGQNSFSQDNITLGSCSSGGICTYYQNVNNINLKITLQDGNGQVTGMEENLSF